jgi:hypothetical protein
MYKHIHTQTHTLQVDFTTRKQDTKNTTAAATAKTRTDAKGGRERERERESEREGGKGWRLHPTNQPRQMEV